MYSLEEIRSFAGTAELKRLLTTVETALKSPENSVIAVSSAQRNEGKTLTAISVAMSTLMLHKNYGKVLVMDLNWHEPSIHDYFDVDFAEPDSGNVRQKLDELKVEKKKK